MIEAGTADILFANEDEVRHLTGCSELADCIEALVKHVPTLVITRGANGAVAVEGDDRVEIAAVPVDRIVDTTGAGDLFAAGFLAARCRGRPLKACLERARSAPPKSSRTSARGPRQTSRS